MDTPSAPGGGAGRSRVRRAATRWSPLVVCAITVVLIVSLTSPPKTTSPHTAAVAQRGTAATTPTTAASGTTATTAAGAATAAKPGATGAQASGTGAAAKGGAAGPSTSPGTVTPAGSSGVSRAGVSCTAGAKQFNWSPYAPPCVPAFNGNNGGSTSHGVSGSTVVLTYREPNSNEQATVESLAGNAFPDDAGMIQDMQTYLKYFNSQFELYGRHVVLEPYPGQGDYLEEDQGQDLTGAQADAATSQSMGAFADVTFSLFASQFYSQDLAEDGVVSFSGLAETLPWFEQYAPYEFSVLPTGTAAANGFIQAVCDRLSGLPAINAGEASFQGETRVFGLIAPDNPQYQDVANLLTSGLQSTCGQSIAKTVSYAIDVSTFEQQATSIVAQMKSAGVTTVICECDPLFPILLDQTADQQQYYPEWLQPGYLDPQGRLPAQDQMAHAISQEGTAIPSQQSEAYRVFQLADPGGAPAEQYYSVAYYAMLYVFDGLQLAGPDLTPANLARGYFEMPTSPMGELGVWQGGQNAFSPLTETQIGWWDPNAVSNFDGQKGAWESCNNGQWFQIDNPASWGPNHTQFACFGH